MLDKKVVALFKRCTRSGLTHQTFAPSISTQTSSASAFINPSQPRVSHDAMAAHPAIKAINTQDITDKARRGLLLLLEAVSKTRPLFPTPQVLISVQVRGKKNLVVERSLASTIGLFVKFSTLQEYGVDKIFFLENHNVDSSQRNIIFLCRGENAKTVRTVAGMSFPVPSLSRIV